MRRLMYIAAALIGTSAAAAADRTDWYVVDFANARCVRGATAPDPDLASPYKAEAWARRNETFIATNITRGDDKSIISVTIRVRNRTGREGTFIFLPSQLHCKVMLKVLMEEGELNDPNELK
jgi:hypothetical protein